MIDRTVNTSPQMYARIGGLLYLYIIVAGLFAEIFGLDKLIVSGDAAATAKNIMAHESLFRVIVAVHLTWLVCAVLVALILYGLLRPVSHDLALLATFFNAVSIAIEAVTTAGLFTVLFFLGGAVNRASCRHWRMFPSGSTRTALARVSYFLAVAFLFTGT